LESRQQRGELPDDVLLSHRNLEPRWPIIARRALRTSVTRCPERRLSLSDLDAEPEVAPGAAKAELEQVIDGHVPATAERVRTYER
jgi:hypothetical protein